MRLTEAETKLIKSLRKAKANEEKRKLSNSCIEILHTTDYPGVRYNICRALDMNNIKYRVKNCTIYIKPKDLKTAKQVKKQYMCGGNGYNYWAEEYLR